MSIIHMLTITRKMMLGKMCIPLFACIAILAGCGSTGPHYTKHDLQVAKTYCARQAETERKAKIENWFTRWLNCLDERAIPVEISLNRANESNIRRVYAKSSELAPKVDSGEMNLRSYNAQMQAFEEELFNMRCLLSVEQSDGSERCVDFQPVRWR
ncbi:MAG: hypothetical protein PHR30_09650 [Gallionellaceae bacterium]|nr:hypothetical protein [Gallionellaceae bacterium]